MAKRRRKSSKRRAGRKSRKRGYIGSALHKYNIARRKKSGKRYDKRRR
jgi:hypothetical protein